MGEETCVFICMYTCKGDIIEKVGDINIIIIFGEGNKRNR